MNSNNADIEYLVSIFEQDLNLLKDYNLKQDIDPSTKAYLRSFIGHLQANKNTHNNDIPDFIDYGTKMMAYLTKNGIKNIDLSEQSLSEILDLMIKPELLKQPILQLINEKAKKNPNHEDIKKLQQILLLFSVSPLNIPKIKQKFSQIREF